MSRTPDRNEPYADSFGRAPSPLPSFVGGHVVQAVQHGQQHGWVVHERTVEPGARNQPDGLVVAQRPTPGVVLDAGDVVLVDVVRRTSALTRNATAIWATLAVLFLVAAVVLGVLLAVELNDDDVVADTTELEAAQQRITDLEAQLTAATGEDGELVATLQQQLQDATTRVAEVEAALADADERLEQATTDLEAITAERDQLLVVREQLTDRVAGLEAQLAEFVQPVALTPTLVGQQQVAVEEFVRVNSLQLVVQQTEDIPAELDPATVEPGEVVAQLPAVDTPLVRGSVVVVTVFRPE